MAAFYGILSKIKEFIAAKRIYFAIFTVILLVAVVCGVISNIEKTRSLPWYSYSNFLWSPDSSRIAFVKEPILLPSQYKQKLGKLEVLTVDCRSRKQSFLGAIEESRLRIIPLGFGKHEDKIYFLKPDRKEPLVYVFDCAYFSGVKKFEIPFENVQNFLYCKDDFVISRIVGEKFEIGLFSAESGYRKFFEKDVNETEGYKLLDASVSFHNRYYALAVWHQSADNLEGITSLVLYDSQNDDLVKTRIDSYGKDMSLEASPDDNILAVKTTSLDESGRRTGNMHYLNFDDMSTRDCIFSGDFTSDFELSWISDGKLLIKTNRFLYLVKPTEQKDVLLAHPIFDKASLAFEIDDFFPSPSGSKMILVRYARGTNMKSEVWVANLDGTSFSRLIEPEGGRKFERMYLYDYMKNCKKVVIDIFNAVTKK